MRPPDHRRVATEAAFAAVGRRDERLPGHDFVEHAIQSAALTTLEMAVFAPMPSASDRVAASVKPGGAASRRSE